MAAVGYAGFGMRLAAAIIDYVLVWVISTVFSLFEYDNSIFAYRAGIFPSFFWVVIMWLYHWLFIGLKGQTPGKMAVSIKVVDARGSKPGLGYAALREIPGKLLSTIAVLLGFLWIIWDGQKQGWHDKIAITHVVGVKSNQ